MFVVRRIKLKVSFDYFTRCQRFSSDMSSDKCKVAVCQLTSSNDKVRNLSNVRTLVQDAAQQGAQVVFLPEASDYVGQNAEETKSMSESLGGSTVSEYKSLARQSKVWLSIGGFHERLSAAEGKQFKQRNAHILINDKGDVVAVYRKLHLYDVCIPEKNIDLKESDMVESGGEIVPPVATPAGQLALSICYDLRFPEISILLRKLGADILTFPSAFTNATGEAHWEVLLRARAIENQCYVIAAAQYGKHNDKRISHGHSLIIDPWGKILAECPKYRSDVPVNNSVAVAEIDLSLIAKVRTEMPVYQHRRNDIYTLMQLNPSPQKITSESFNFADKIIPTSTVFYQSSFSFAFTNIRCVVPGHVLVSSLRPASRLQDLTPEEVSDLFQTTVKVQKVIEKEFSANSSTVCVQDGKYAGQTVPHVHVHILPRKEGDFERNDEVYEKLSMHDRDLNPQPMRSLEEMSKEAAVLRMHFEIGVC